jgi:gliding motility-associated-like protein
MNRILTLLFLFIGSSLFGQLTDFDLQVTKTDETCLGNGTLTFNVTNVTPLATILYSIYQLPDTDVPISVINTNVLGSLNAGTYRVVATQALNALSNTKQQDIVIENEITPLTFSLSAANQACTSGGKIIVNTLSGVASTYEILSGPVTRAAQTSNEFANLPQGAYNIRVTNDCGVGVVQAYTLLLNPAPPVIADTSYPDVSLAGCNSINVSNTITAPVGSTISYPISVEYTITPPNGDPPIVTTENFGSGGATVEVVKNLPLYGNAPYTYTMQFVDACGTTVTKNGNIVNPLPIIAHHLTPNTCGKQFLELEVFNFFPPYTLNFVSAPAGFDPLDYNTVYPGPFADESIVFGTLTNTLPEGTYEVSVTDACGRVGSSTFTIVNTLPPPIASGRNNGCYATIGRITITAQPRFIESGSIVVAPVGYPATLPQNVTSMISGGNLIISNVPIGDYEVLVTDNCGNTYTLPVNVPAFVEQDFFASTRIDCSAGNGSVQIRSGNGRLSNVSITAAPAAFTQSLPFNVSASISATTGELFLEALPEGTYTFSGIDVCGIQRIVNVPITGYHPDSDPYTFVQNCGSFDVRLHDSAAALDASYWLQQQDPATGQWMHPQSGAPYTTGAMPDATTSLPLTNNATLYNTVEEGTYRVVKVFAGYANASGDKMCFEVLGEFTFIDGIRITNAYTLACLNTPNDVYLQVEGGLAPYNYRITQFNGSSLSINNGSSNIFTGLTVGVYKFEVEDACGNIDPAIINISTLPSLVQATNPGNFVQCVDAGTPLTGNAFDLSTAKTEILGSNQSASQYTVTYYLSLADANAAVNAIPESYTNISSPQTVYARVVHNAIPICNAVAVFDLVVSEKPALEMATKSYLCDGSTATLVADAGFANYEWNHAGWASPLNGRTLTVDETGLYNLTVTNSNGCTTDIAIQVDLSEVPSDISFDLVDWTTHDNSITVHVNGVGDYLYSLDNTSFQVSNVFDHLETGVYTVYVKDANGCGMIHREVVLLSYPKFFTPNGDGANERWKIKYQMMEPDMEVEIYDRLGKLITSFKGDDEGWDGTYNGARLPSTDYWFVVKRHDGRVLKGHFAMLR